MMYLTLNAVDKCVNELVDTVQLFPDFGQAHAALALLYTINENWSKGLVHARKALARNVEIRPQLVDLCLSSCSYNLDLPVEGVFDYSVFDSSAVYNIDESLLYLPVVDVKQLDHSDHSKKILFVYADEKYFYEHVLALVCSLRETAADWVVHLHICNPSAKLEQNLHDFQKKVSPLEIRYSYEHGNLTRYGDTSMYHSCVRFCRLFQMVSNNSNTVVMLDADMLIRNTPDSLSGIDDVGKVMGLTKTECEPYWATIRAGFCFFKRSELSLSFLGKLSQFIIDNLRSRKGHWFIDQMGLSILYSKITDHTAVMLLPASECCDSTISDESTIWAIVNDKSSLGKYNICKNEILKSYGLE